LTIEPKIESSWLAALSQEFRADYFSEIKKKLLLEKSQYRIFPPGASIFSAYNMTPLSEIKVVIIGQDPYHGYGQANGMCFSVNEGVPHPPSLQNIFREVSDNFDFPYPKSGDLSPWAKQGVFLLNASLTVREGQANAHKDIGWQRFTDATIKAISDQKENVIFLLWGGFAKRKVALIDKSKHLVLTSGHPSPLSANRGYWFGNQHFLKVNEVLKKRGEKAIDWKIV
jgi:uracil-DNA glycosylase